jgi:hypothetical protein
MSAYETQMAGISKSISYLVTAVRAGTMISDAKNTAYHGWNVQGYLQCISLGSPVEVLANDSPEEQKAKLQLQDLAILGDFCESQESLAYSASATAEAKLNVVQILTIAQTIFSILKQLGIIKKPPVNQNGPVATSITEAEEDPLG